MLKNFTSPFIKGIHPEGFFLKEIERDFERENPLYNPDIGNTFVRTHRLHFQHEVILKVPSSSMPKG